METPDLTPRKTLPSATPASALPPTTSVLSGPRKSRELGHREGQKADTLSIQVGGFGRYAGLIRAIFFIIGLLADVILPAVLDAPGPWLHEDPAPQGRCVEVTPRASKKAFQLDLAPGGQLDWNADEPTSP